MKFLHQVLNWFVLLSPLQQLCLDIYLVRESNELALEEDLFAKLVFLYRSPETIIKWTREREDTDEDDDDDDENDGDGSQLQSIAN